MSDRDDVIAGRYRLLDRVGSGGMGAVWRASDELLERDVAVKQLHVESGPAGAAEKPEIRHQRAMREARIAARLHHPHAVPVFDAVEHLGQPYLVMQYLPSQSLQEILAEHATLAPPVVAQIGTDVASALAAAHRLGIIHRDVKPGNVLIAADGTAKITDFGIAHLAGDAILTSRGVITGTPAFLAPEVAKGEPSSEASDVFSLGATLYRALEGHPPFPSQDNPLALLHLVASGAITPPEHSAHLTPLLLRMLAVNPAGRPSMDEVAHLLRQPGERLTVTPAITARSSSDTDPTVASSTSSPAAEEAGAVTTLTLARTAAQPAPAPEQTAPTEPSEDREERPDAQPPFTTVAERPLAGEERPVAGDPSFDHTDRRWGTVLVLLALAVALALVLATTGVIVSRRSQQDAARATGDSAALGSEAEASGEPDPAAATSDPGQPNPSAPDPSDPTPSTGTAAGPQSPASTTPGASSTASAPTSGAGSGSGSADPATTTQSTTQAETAIRHYYDLLPENTDAGWELLTDNYRRTTAKSRAVYGTFWASIDTVSVSDAQGSGSGSVTATITYQFTDGRTYVERTQYQLVQDGTVLKIDQSDVLSSSQR